MTDQPPANPAAEQDGAELRVLFAMRAQYGLHITLSETPLDPGTAELEIDTRHDEYVSQFDLITHRRLAELLAELNGNNGPIKRLIIRRLTARDKGNEEVYGRLAISFGEGHNVRTFLRMLARLTEVEIPADLNALKNEAVLDMIRDCLNHSMRRRQQQS